MAVVAINLQLNGAARTVQAGAHARLLDVLREDLGLKGTRMGCGSNHCGACQVLLDGRAVAACDTPWWAVDGHALTTVEGLPAALHEAFQAEQAAQCGYCSSGMQVAAAALLRVNPRPTRAHPNACAHAHARRRAP